MTGVELAEQRVDSTGPSGTVQVETVLQAGWLLWIPGSPPPTGSLTQFWGPGLLFP